MYLKHRILPRKRNWDYSWHGKYFITICTKNRINYCGKIHKNEMELNNIGKIAHDFAWQTSYFDRIIKDEKELQNTRTYIFNNPVHWIADENNI
jgi:REP element-mobilizing transposase RayT